MLVHTSSSSSSSVCTESYYGHRPDDNYASTADSGESSSSAAPPPSLPQPDCIDDYYSSSPPPSLPHPDSRDCYSSPPLSLLQPDPEPNNFTPPTCSNNKRKRKRSSLNQDLVNKLNMEIVVMFDSLLHLYSLNTDFDFDLTGLEKVFQYIFENCEDIVREYEKDFKYISAICKDAMQGSGWSFSDTEKVKKKKTLDMNMKGVYLCKECDRAFDDFRALGGHSAAHNRQKRDAAAAADAEAAGADSDGSSHLCLNEQKNKGYACNLCPRIFSTGQALGGHKTYHRRIAECGGQVETQAVTVLCHSPVSSEVENSFSTGQALGGHKTYHRSIADCAGQVETQAETDLCCSPDSSVVENSVVFTKFDLNAPPDEGLWGCD